MRKNEACKNEYAPPPFVVSGESSTPNRKREARHIFIDCGKNRNESEQFFLFRLDAYKSNSRLTEAENSSKPVEPPFAISSSASIMRESSRAFALPSSSQASLL